MSATRPPLFAALFLVTAIAIGCGAPGKPTPAAFEHARNQIYARAHTEFDQAVFYKPTDEWSDELGTTLAPLLMQETAKNPFRTNHIGRVVPLSETTKIDREKPTVYYHKETIDLKGSTRNRALFLWFHELNGSIVPQGVRITLDSDDHPAIWEILNDTSGVEQVFVSQSLEAKATEVFGPPLSGRHSSLEKNPREAPTVVVARVISDGPMTMGPVIYQDAKRHDVATLICRCMPPQVESLVASKSYDVLEMADPAVQRSVTQALQRAGIPPGRWIGEDAQEMNGRLRLPEKF